MDDRAAFQALTDDAAIVDRGGDGPTGRALIVATGADRIRFLNGLLTGKVAGTPVGGGCRSVLLTTKGHVVADLELFIRPDEVWMLVAGGQADGTAAALSRYAIMDDFAAAARPDVRILSVQGPRATARLGDAGVDVGALAGGAPLSHAEVSVNRGAGASALWVVRVREFGAAGFCVVGPAADVDGVAARLVAAGVPTLPSALAEAARIAALEPRWGVEITPDYFPMEVGRSGAIDYGKGCYLGQEPIVRIRDRGHINWRLVGLDLAAPVADGDPVPGDTLEADVKPRAGRITSAARLPDGRGVALALLHVSVPVGAALRIKHGEATLAATVRAESGTDAGP